MARELAFVLINPYTIAKSRTGGVIARFMSRTGLDLVGACMIGPSAELAEKYAELVGKSPEKRGVGGLLADYIVREYSPEPDTGLRHRVMLLLFEGENAVRKVRDVAGHVRPQMTCGETIRDTYGDFILADDSSVKYFEPAVLVGPGEQETIETLRLWASFSESDGGLLGDAGDVPRKGDVQRTLVLLKPDNFRFPSLRAGNIIDVLSCSGLRIIGAKVVQMTVAQAEEFYGPVRASLEKKCGSIVSNRAGNALAKEFGFDMPNEIRAYLKPEITSLWARDQFGQIVKFMTGYFPWDCPESEKQNAGREKCLALVYKGVDAVQKIRRLVGPTDPSQAEPGSVRREFGSNIMVNAAHASDSPENAERELGIIRMEKDTVRRWVEEYHGLE